MSTKVSIHEYETSDSVSLTDSQICGLQSFRTFITILAGTKTGEYRLEANSWVGSIRIPGLSITVIPKIGNQNLLKLLLLGDGEAKPRDAESIISREDTFWDLLGNSLFQQVVKINSRGLEKDYVELEENLTFPLGQVLFGVDLINNVPIRNGIFCRHSQRTENIKQNQILKWGVDILSQLAGDQVSSRLTSASKLLDQVESVSVCPEFTLPSRNDYYFNALYLITILKKFLSITMGSYGAVGCGYLLNMNDVFEGFVREQIRTRLRNLNYEVAYKGVENRNLCEGVSLEPDMVILDQEGDPVAIADCKYKRDSDYKSADTYQMLAYLEGYLPVNLAIVIFPTQSQELKSEGVWLPRHRRLIRIGIPQTDLLNSIIWDQAAKLFASYILNTEKAAG